mgnify:CR=1 FL=1
MNESDRWVREERQGAVATLTIDRPNALNALNQDVLGQLRESVDAIASDATVRAMVLPGAGTKAFVAGADIVAMSTMRADEAMRYAEQGHALMDAIEAMPQPVIAAVNGFALGGGCELALACDLIYASQNARFGQPEVKLGLMPGFGGAARLPRKIGQAAAAEWIYTGEMYSAEQARDVGLVRAVLPGDELLPHCLKIATTIASRAPLAVSASKQVLVRGGRVGGLEAASMERDSFARLFATEDMREGTKAFVEKREPSFKGA